MILLLVLLISDYVGILKGIDTITLNAKQERRADIFARTFFNQRGSYYAASLQLMSLA